MIVGLRAAHVCSVEQGGDISGLLVFAAIAVAAIALTWGVASYRAIIASDRRHQILIDGITKRGA